MTIPPNNTKTKMGYCILGSAQTKTGCCILGSTWTRFTYSASIARYSSSSMETHGQQTQGSHIFIFHVQGALGLCFREPLAYAFLYSNFFHEQRKNRHFKQAEPTESNLLRWSLHNLQCQFLAQGEYSLQKKIKQPTMPEQCEKVHNIILETMNWISMTN
jgi:hypothetical protein